MQKLILALMIAAIVSMVVSPLFIPLLKRLKFGQTVRTDGPETHLAKSGTPTMGGVIIVAGILTGTLLINRYSLDFTLWALLATVAYGLIGFLDDFIKIKLKRSLGLRAYQKIIGQFLLALAIALLAYKNPNVGSKLYIAFLDIEWDLGIFYIPFVVFAVVAITNSVNLIDGLDGLCSGVSMIYACAMALIFFYLASAAELAGLVEYGANLGGMAVFCAAVGGACMGFLKSNSYPAKVFMGDTGSLALGGALAMMAILSRSLLLFIIMGACYVASALSVVLQVGSYKLRKKRIFKMAPLHHHFELCGYKETKIVAVYMIVTALLCLVGLLAYV